MHEALHPRLPQSISAVMDPGSPRRFDPALHWGDGPPSPSSLAPAVGKNPTHRNCSTSKGSGHDLERYILTSEKPNMWTFTRLHEADVDRVDAQKSRSTSRWLDSVRSSKRDRIRELLRSRQDDEQDLAAEWAIVDIKETFSKSIEHVLRANKVWKKTEVILKRRVSPPRPERVSWSTARRSSQDEEGNSQSGDKFKSKPRAHSAIGHARRRSDEIHARLNTRHNDNSRSQSAVRDRRDSAQHHTKLPQRGTSAFSCPRAAAAVSVPRPRHSTKSPHPPPFIVDHGHRRYSQTSREHAIYDSSETSSISSCHLSAMNDRYFTSTPTTSISTAGPVPLLHKPTWSAKPGFERGVRGREYVTRTAPQLPPTPPPVDPKTRPPPQGHSKSFSGVGRMGSRQSGTRSPSSSGGESDQSREWSGVNQGNLDVTPRRSTHTRHARRASSY